MALYGILGYQLPRNNDAALSLEKDLSTEKTSRFRVKATRGTRLRVIPLYGRGEH